MDIQQMVNELHERLATENIRLKEQEKIVEDLGKKYSEQCAILKVFKDHIKNLNKSITELNELNQAPGRDAKLSKELMNSGYEEDELTKLLNEGVDVCIRTGLIAEEVKTKIGTTMSIRRSTVTRARNTILRYCGDENPVKWISKATDDDICKLRYVGKTTLEAIKIARSIINGKAIKGYDPD